MNPPENTLKNRECKYCRQVIHSSASICHHCQQYQKGFDYFIAGYLPAIVALIAMLISWFQLNETRKERMTTERIKNEIVQIATITSDLVAETATYTGWGVNSIPNIKDRNNFYKKILANSSELLNKAGKNPEEFSSIRQLQGLINYVEGGHEGVVNKPNADELEKLFKETKE